MAIVRPHRAARGRSLRRLPALLLVVLLMIASGCTADEAPAAPPDDLELVEGREIYIRSCANCHGGGGGGGVGSKLDEGRVLDRYPDPAEQIALVEGGVRAMPGFDEKLTEAGIQAVVRYTREVLTAPG